MRISDFIFDFAHLLYYKCHKLRFKQGKSYINAPNWLKTKKTMKLFTKKDIRCFQYHITVPLNNKETGKYPERITKIKPFIDKYNWEGIN